MNWSLAFDFANVVYHRQFGRAAEDFEQALTFQPDHKNAKKYLVIARQKLGLPSVEGRQQSSGSNDSTSAATSKAESKTSTQPSRVDPTSNRGVVGLAGVKTPSSEDASSRAQSLSSASRKRRVGATKSHHSSPDSYSDSSSVDSSDEEATKAKIMRLLVQERLKGGSLVRFVFCLILCPH